MRKKLHYLVNSLIMISAISCGNSNSRSIKAKEIEPKDNEGSKQPIELPIKGERKIAKAIYYLENSGSMFGYVNGFSEYVDVVSELSEKPEFVDQKTKREFNFVNGGNNIRVTNIGEDPAILKDKLNLRGYNCGDVTRSNLNAMFQLALSKAINDTITVLITDAIYDIGNPEAPLNVLSTEGKETRSRFIERLNEGDLQTLIVKLSSHFEGNYYPVTGGVIRLSQKRPFYIFIFGETELLNNYFSEDYIKSLDGYEDLARFLIPSELDIPYQITTVDMIGSFKFNKRNKNKLESIKKDRHGNGFQFVFAADFSSIPYSDSYLKTLSNYSCSNPDFEVSYVEDAGNIKLYGLNFEPTHLIAIKSIKSPFGLLDVSLNNSVPDWISRTNSENEKNIINDTTYTFGFKFLTSAISEAYTYKSQTSDLATFTFELLK